MHFLLGSKVWIIEVGLYIESGLILKQIMVWGNYSGMHFENSTIGKKNENISNSPTPSLQHVCDGPFSDRV